MPTVDGALKLILLISLLSRVAVVVFAYLVSLETEGGLLVSPFVEIRFGDYDFYAQNISTYYRAVKEPFWHFYLGGSVEDWLEGTPQPGPLMPYLLDKFDYANNPHVLALSYLLSSALLVFFWCLYYRSQGVSLWGQLALVAFPLLLWYSVVISTELPMSIALLIFFYSALVTPLHPISGRLGVVVAFIFMLLVRPNAVCIFPALLFVLIRGNKHISISYNYFLIILSTVAFLYSITYYAPYFVMVDNSSSGLTYWGLTPAQYHDGIFGFVPVWVDKLLSLGSLLISKFMYASGLRPSYSDVSMSFVLLRGIAGVLIFPGIFYCLYRGSYLEKILSLCFLLPLLITVAQERYLLPIAPILAMYGARWWKIAFVRSQELFLR